ncbi:lysylphosphatidylglycerol synthase domain-containing protein [Pseudomonas sp. DTU_2021_1001937_2_SI_NGA_ILE_001]|uniref:lysylphosphatidylglycerol synthase domain-containing protein n=1 Tax=Pseudomonas sp. DTU_2021_1001937_2_SI_NGA_ILE_001 TaxID=3077589 RepID=UPI0028FC30DD|nr:lysylphosphatidylglycerol synthase domain-containing protein [Pseudomonas sp. DTU_2021_1001937_2_SI_NGA_ILE_001]WNW10894.1 lysylphosphatidylglycerol synthase domain-containing protein [Pseudomonas sp. DTU_2021_1001937_2_SI_NGA_ILE_001]
MSQAGTAERNGHSPSWTWAKRGLKLFFFIAVPVLLFLLVKNLDWQEVLQALRSYKASTLALAAGVAATSYLVYCGFDILARFYTRHRLSIAQVIPVTFVCYAFNLNLSSWVGGIALRYRLYSRLGLDVPTITRVLSLSLITNWLGYMLLAGVVFSAGFLELPPEWSIGSTTLRLIGLGLLALCAAYLLACRFSRRRSWTVRDQEIVLPSLGQALLQAGLGALNWSLMALVIFTLLPEKAFYPAILGVLLISSIAGVITHIPAGLGVLETVFITLLAHQFSKSTLLAALIGYRAIYFLLPLLLAVVVYLVLEKRAKALSEKNRAAG